MRCNQLFDAGVGVLIAESEQDLQSSITLFEPEIAGRHRCIEDDGSLSGFFGRQSGGELIQKSPSGPAKSLTPQLRPEPTARMHHVVTVDKPAHDRFRCLERKSALPPSVL